jgi:aminoacylase
MASVSILAPCVEFLRKLADDLGLNFTVEYPASKPIVILTWIGSQPELKSILLNSHMDVVPVFEEFWTHKPFAADIDEDGKIFARGSQDMKCVATQYLGAIRKLKKDKVQLQRTIHVVFVPDEENFGPDGWKVFANTKAFDKMNVGFALDEGIASPSDVYAVFYGEKTCWREFRSLSHEFFSKFSIFRCGLPSLWPARSRFLAFERDRS